jgi:phosphoserine phosphatase RsbU/P
MAHSSEQWHPATNPELGSFKKLASGMRLHARRLWLRSKSGWSRLTSGMELEELWSQFKTEAEQSSRLYKQDLHEKVAEHKQEFSKSWKRPFRIFGALFWSVLRKLSPARRLFLLLTIVMAFLAVVNFHFLIITQEVEFILAFVGLLILLILVLGDHISMKRDIEIAREIQRWLVPRRAPDVPGVDIAFATVPAKTVGGDYFDVFLRGMDGPLLIAVADVSGKSVPAAMLMATFQGGLRALGNSSGSLSDLAVSLNQQACANSQNGRFTTAFLAELNPATGELKYLCAGHNPPILKREDGSFERLESENIPLGIEPQEKYKAGVTRMEHRDLLVIYTDGVTEARNEDEEEFGEERLMTIMQGAGQDQSSFTLAKIMQDLQNFVGHAPQHDDITCLVVGRG